MWKNNYKIALRNMQSSKVFSAINIFGLATGLACCMLMFLFIQDELSFDNFHQKGKNIYRVTSRTQSTDEKKELAVAPAPWAPLMKKDYPEIKQYVRLLKDERSLIGEKGKEHSFINNVIFADSSFFDVFSFPLLKGNPVSALTIPNSIVLTREAAVKIFGNADPMGKMIEVNTSYTSTMDVQVTGVTETPPANSHFTFGALISLSTFGDMSTLWSYHMHNTYLVLENNASRQVVENKLKSFSDKYLANNPNADGKQDIHLQALADIHLHSNLVGELESNGDIRYIYIFSGIALFVLFIACLNFMNLSTVRSLKRAKEVGMRKVIGAARSQLIRQFLVEAIVVSFFALMLAIVLVVLALPVLNHLSERSLKIGLEGNYGLLSILFILTGLVGLVSGIYPAVVLSSFNPIDVLKGSFQNSNKGTTLRKVLVTLQFVICIALISSTIIVYNQLQFIQNKKLGFNQEKVIVVNLPKNSDPQKLETFKTMIKNISGVLSVSAASNVPGTKIPVNLVHNGNSSVVQNTSMQMLFVDNDFLKTMQIKIIGGRDFSRDFPEDPNEAFILNREAARQLGFTNTSDALGKPFQWVLPEKPLKTGKIIGVVDDFNITPLKTAVQPLVLHIVPRRFQFLYVRINSNDVITAVEKKFTAYNEGQPFEYSFLDETIQAMYASEKKLEKMFGYFSALAILLACLGILGLSIYYAQQRMKEIGIRKVLGASTRSIVRELSGEFLQPVVIAALIASPLAWWAMSKWLQDFAYRIDISWWVFAIAGFVAIIIAMITISFQAIRAALANPVNSLRAE